MAWTKTALASPQNAYGTNEIRVVELEGTVEISPAGTKTWVPAETNEVLHPFDRLRTGVNSRTALLWSDQSVMPFSASTEIEILPPQSPDAQCGLHLVRGIISFFHRGKPGQIQIITRGAVAGIEGTEFVMAVNGADETMLSVIDGKVKLGNEHASLVLTNGQQAIVEPGQAPVRTAGFIANNLLQWCFYYPAVLDLNDLPLAPGEQKTLKASLDAYRAGDLLLALKEFPAQPAGSSAEQLYHAALLLSVGNVDGSEQILDSLTNDSKRIQRLAAALRELIAAVKQQDFSPASKPKLATEFLARSYYEQSQAVPGISLKRALALARQAAATSPQFGFAWERVAELKFSFGHALNALDALNKSLALSPRNAQALALKGFLLVAQNHTHRAIVWFDRALAADSSLGNAWLGRGLCRIRLGDELGGREDLLVAAALEPQRAVLRSYLGKAYANAGEFKRATREFHLAKKLDPNDPTAWLYSALLDQERNRINDAIRDLEKSKELNDNRSVYRSQLLLDQDQAVRSASLATMYQDDGMFDLSMREAAQAVSYDYANYSAHLFLGDSYSQLRDPNAFNERYETPSAAEYLIANLLAPVSAGVLSSTISQGEYSKLFTQDGFGMTSDTEYLSRGAWTESGAQFGTSGNFSYDFEAYYHADPGQRVNDAIEQHDLSLSLKQQFTPKDTVYLSVEQYEAESGYVEQLYDPDMTDPSFQEKETQNPIVGLGYHHEWSPGVHTLLYLTRLEDIARWSRLDAPAIVVFRPYILGVSTITSVHEDPMNENYVGRLAIYSGELQQIWEQPVHTTIVGTRIQYGHFNASSVQDNFYDPFYGYSQYEQDNANLFKRFSFYAYHQWQIFEPLQLIGGLAYDRITFPENYFISPLSNKETTEDQFSPKAGMIWTPLKKTTVRFAYTRSLAGASLDQSAQIEPVQVAGFLQSFRSIIPESIAGGITGARFETYDLSLDQEFQTGTYLSLSGEMLNSTADRVFGDFDFNPFVEVYPVPSGLPEDLDYQEKTLQFTANQLLGKEWSLGANYRISRAVLFDNFVDIPNSVLAGFYNFQPRQRTKGVLSRLDLTAIYNHPSGFFAEGEALWFDQSNEGYADEPGDDFWQFNLYAGYRSPRRRAELSIGLLNIAGQDYNLNPLNLYNELPRTRTVAVSLRLNF